MGQKYVIVDGNNIVQEVFDEDNNNVPNGALPITDSEMTMFGSRYTFSDFEVVGGSLQITADADDNVKTRIINGFDIKMLKAFAEIIMDELNILRDQHGLAPRTMAQLKTAMKNKLS